MDLWGLEPGKTFLFFSVVVPLTLTPLIYDHYRRHRLFRGWPAFLTLATMAYACVLIGFTLYPFRPMTPVPCSLQENFTYWKLTPFHSLTQLARAYGAHGFPGVLWSFPVHITLFNLLLTLPLGLLLAYRYRKGLLATLCISLAVSLSIEIAQGTAGFGVFGCRYRQAEMDDLIINTAGAAIGWLMGRGLSPRLPRLYPQPRGAPGNPGLARRGAALVIDACLTAAFAAALGIALGSPMYGLEAFASLNAAWLLDNGHAVQTVLPGVALFLVLPLLRSDRATLGQICTWLVLTGPDGGAAGRRVPLYRFATRWVPWILLLMLVPACAFPILFLCEASVVLMRRDRRSLAGLLAGSRTATRPAAHDTGTGS